MKEQINCILSIHVEFILLYLASVKFLERQKHCMAENTDQIKKKKRCRIYVGDGFRVMNEQWIEICTVYACLD